MDNGKHLANKPKTTQLAKELKQMATEIIPMYVAACLQMQQSYIYSKSQFVLKYCLFHTDDGFSLTN